jgi:hypothetical protein
MLAAAHDAEHFAGDIFNLNKTVRPFRQRFQLTETFLQARQAAFLARAAALGDGVAVHHQQPRLGRARPIERGNKIFAQRPHPTGFLIALEFAGIRGKKSDRTFLQLRTGSLELMMRQRPNRHDAVKSAARKGKIAQRPHRLFIKKIIRHIPHVPQERRGQRGVKAFAALQQAQVIVRRPKMNHVQRRAFGRLRRKRPCALQRRKQRQRVKTGQLFF